MTLRIESATEPTRWSAHTVLVHLHKDRDQLATDAASGADPHTLAADKAALIESRQQVARMRGSHLVDLTV